VGVDRLWQRLGIGAALRGVAEGRRLDGDAVERVLFALVAQRALEPGSKLAATGWVSERVAIADCAGFGDDATYRAMDFLLDALDEIASQIFVSVAHLLKTSTSSSSTPPPPIGRSTSPTIWSTCNPYRRPTTAFASRSKTVRAGSASPKTP
jgi:hypothetical protein